MLIFNFLQILSGGGHQASGAHAMAMSHLAHALPPTGVPKKPQAAGGILSSRPPTAPGNRPQSPAPSRLHMQATATATRRGDKSASPPPGGSRSTIFNFLF